MKPSPSPPRPATRLIRRLDRYRTNHAIVDDMHEVFSRICREKSFVRACLWYWAQCLDAVAKDLLFKARWGLIMTKNYLIIALRSIKKHRAYSFINIIGLAIGIAVCMLIFLYVDYELSFDSHIIDKKHIYRVVTHINRPEGQEYTGGAPFPTAAAMRSDFPGLEKSTQTYLDSDVMITVGEDRYIEDEALFVETMFFELFCADWIQGTMSQAFNDPFTVILTERLADKYYGDTNVIGKVLRLNNKFDLRVAGVVSNPPRVTSIPYDMLISWKTLEAYWNSSRLNRWDFIDGESHTFIRLPEYVGTQSLENRFESFEQKYMDSDYAKSWSFRLQPLGDIHFNPRYGSYNYITSRTVLYAFSTIGLLILVMACINFINLTTAQAMNRTREIGMRKVLGAHRAQLVRQLIGETSLFTLISILAALLLVWSVLAYLNRFLGNNTELQILSDGRIFFFLGIVYLLVSGLNGIYPSIASTRQPPAETLKERLSYRRKRAFVFRNSLVLIQFVISQMLIVGTLIIAGQMKFMSNKDLGFRSEEVLTVPIPVYEEARCEALRSRWMQNPHIREVSFAWAAPASRSDFSTPLEYEASGDIVEFPVFIKMCDKRYLKIYKIPLIAGRFFARNANDESDIQWVVSASVTRRMGLSGPQEAVGKRITVNDIKGDIIGVIGDFHEFSLHSELQPTVFFNFWPSNFREAQILLDMQDVGGSISQIQEVWSEFYPEYVFQYEFLDEYIKGMYESESKLMILIQSASFLSILIGCLGLFGLVSIIVIQRSKEIGVRKILGGTAASIYSLLSREFLKWVALANVIAWPVAYYAMHRWLQNFAFRITIGWEIFLISGSAAFIISLMTVSFQVIKATTANPVDSLRYE